MKKIISLLVFMFMFMFSLAGCNGPSESVSESTSTPAPTVEKYTVQFYVDEVLYKTLKVVENTTIGSDKVDDPMKDGFTFVSICLHSLKCMC